MTHPVVSPFANNTEENDSPDAEGGAVATATSEASYTPLPSDDEPLELTWENVDMVLDEMRPYLLQDGGNVAISEIDGPVVRLELQVRVLYGEELHEIIPLSLTDKNIAMFLPSLHTLRKITNI